MGLGTQVVVDSGPAEGTVRSFQGEERHEPRRDVSACGPQPPGRDREPHAIWGPGGTCIQEHPEG